MRIMIIYNRLKSTLMFIKNNTFANMFILICLPIAAILIFLIIFANLYTINYKKLIKSSYNTQISALVHENEATITNTKNVVSCFLNDKTTSQLSDPDTYKNFIEDTTNNIPALDSILIYNKDNGTVYNGANIINAITFFSYEYNYLEYPRSYLEAYNPISGGWALPPSLVYTPIEQKIVIPLVFSPFTDKSANIIVIANINISNLINITDTEKPTENSSLLIINKKNRNIFNPDNTFMVDFDTAFYENISASGINSFNSHSNGKKVYVVSYSPENSFGDYAYVAIIPQKDIFNAFPVIIRGVAIFCIASIIILLIIAYWVTRRLYKPIDHLQTVFLKNHAKADAGNAWDIIFDSVKKTIDSNTEIKNELLNTLPVLQEHELINFLNSNEHYLKRPSVNFRYNMFCSIVIKMLPLEKFYYTYNYAQYIEIKKALRNILISYFLNKFDYYLLSSDADTLYLLLNLDGDSHMDEIKSSIDEFSSALSYDTEYISLKIGIGNIYESYIGLKKSHIEAINAISFSAGFSLIQTNAEKYIFRINDENYILNSLITNRISNAKNKIKNIIDENIKENVSVFSLKQLYTQILNLIFKVCRMKEISYSPDNTSDIKLISDILALSSEQINSIIENYLNMLDEHTQKNNDKCNINIVMQYINKNYMNDIYLDKMAEYFNVSPKYLSKLIKDNLGITFVEYLTNLRITKAQELLKDTDISIGAIQKNLGFEYRSTFLRAFKKVVGMSPSEYRNKIKNC